jgi:transposase
METEDQVAELKKEKTEVERQLKVALGRVVELEEESRQREAALRQRITELEEELKRQRESTQEKLKAEQESIQAQLGKMQSQIRELKGQGAKNSQNSSQPPSSDGLKRKTHSRRKSSGRKSGGQNGHAGATRELSQTIDTVVLHRPARCEQCGEDLRAFQGQVVERRQVQDLPKIGLLVEEHQVEEVCCLHCQWKSRGFFPPEIKAVVQYGPNVRAWAVYLNQYQLIPMERTCQLMSEGLGCSISEGTLSNWLRQASQGLEATMANIKQGLIHSRLNHDDETGIHIGKQLHWLHTACTRFLTYLQWHPKRGREALDEIGILPAFHGRVMRDRLSSYDAYDCDQSVCGSHLQRDARGVWELGGQQWAARMEGALETMNKVAHFWRHRGVRSVPKPLRDYWVAEYFDILAAGYAAQPPPVHPPETLPKRKGPPKQTPAKNLLDAFLKRAEQVLAFMDDLSLPFTNNQAERDLRMAKVQQKISGTFRSEEGATCFSRIRSYLSTMSKQGHAMLEALVAVFNGCPLPIAWSF